MVSPENLLDLQGFHDHLYFQPFQRQIHTHEHI